MRAPRLLAALALLGCGPDAPEAVRGPGLAPAELTAEQQAGVYEAALRTAFDLEPALVLLAHPRLLPRTAGFAGGDSLPAAVLAALRARRVVRGTCEPPDAFDDTPVCDAAEAGYVVRFSPVLAMAGDSVQVHLHAQRYMTSPTAPQEALRFESAFQLVPAGSRWRVVRSARVPIPEEDSR